jgi:hypothetical protein
VETLRVLIVRAAELKYDVDGLVTMIQGMFSDTDPGQRSLRPLLTLSTIHKAKGTGVGSGVPAWPGAVPAQ